MEISKKLPYDPVIPLLGIYLKKMNMLIQNDTIWFSSSISEYFSEEKNNNLKTYMYKINKVLLYSIGNYMQYSEINHNGKEHEKEYNWITLLYTKN